MNVTIMTENLQKPRRVLFMYKQATPSGFDASMRAASNISAFEPSAERQDYRVARWHDADRRPNGSGRALAR